MGWSPSVIIVVRHGARLDAADKQWHLTSPTPYDPPLTYGGWTQSRALGARIASILRSRETDDDTLQPDGDTLESTKKHRRRHKVVIHTSPFLRCVQTSVAISAGLAQNPGRVATATPSPAMKAMHSSPKIRPLVTGSPALRPVPELGPTLNGKQEQPENMKKSTIRVDAFLGEWLSPDYFELITPPPSSVMMVAGAKADLLRREDYSTLIHVRDVNVHANQPFPGGWGSPVVAPKEDKEKDEAPLPSLSSLGAALPMRERTSSLSSVGSHGSRNSHKSASSLQVQTPVNQCVYQPPTPTYAISSSDPIPPGYVAHARDACVDVDYQWDSMREPQNWGNGGEYGEEWSSMHKRFRSGLQNMMHWYRDSNNPAKLSSKLATPNNASSSVEDTSEDEDTDLVVILVTHGAGCNALIGALTNQPVLLDVGMASLTMAVRKPTPPNSPLSSPTATPKSHSRASSRTITIPDQYEVKLVANTEHLRTSASSTPSSSRAPSLQNVSTYRDRYNSPGSNDVPGFGRSRPATVNSNLGSIRRTVSVASPNSRGYSSTRNYSPAPTSSIGLWTAPQTREELPDEPEEDDMILTFGDSNGTAGADPDEGKQPSKVSSEEAIEDEENNEADDVPPLGLWGTPKPPGLAEKIREIGPKRRWTVNERT